MTALSKVSSPVPGRRMRAGRPLLAVLAVALLALVSTGCNSGAAWIARVDGKAIDSPNFWEGVPLYAELSGSPTASLPAPEGVSPVSDAATYAMFLVQLHALKVLTADRHLTVTDADLAAERQTLLGSPQAAQFKKLPSWFLDQIVEAQATFEALIASYGKHVDQSKEIADYYRENKAQFAQVCMDVIGGSDENELAAARDRIREGASFATVAKAVAAGQKGSDGKPSPALGAKGDGDVGCLGISTLSQLFATPTDVSMLTDAEPNSLVGPVPVAGGAFMLFRVRSTKTQSLAEVRPAIEQVIGQAGQQQAQNALNEYLRTADIELSPRIGTWTKGVGYTPPVGAEQPKGATTTVPTALTGAAG